VIDFAAANVGVSREDFGWFALILGSFFFVSIGKGSLLFTVIVSPRDGHSLTTLGLSVFGVLLVSNKT
jgi:hypothetical protein